MWIFAVLRGAADAKSPRVGSSIYGAVQQLCLAARAYGIGTSLTTLYGGHEEELRDLLGLPADALAMALIPMGYPAQGRWAQPKRRPVEEVVHWDRWGRPASADRENSHSVIPNGPWLRPAVRPSWQAAGRPVPRDRVSAAQSVTTTLPCTCRPACSVTASRIRSIGNTSAIGTVIRPAAIASASWSSAPGSASTPPVARTPPGGLGPAATVEIRSGGTPSASAASAVSVPNRSVAAVTPPGASARTRSASPGAVRDRLRAERPQEVECARRGGADHGRPGQRRQLHREHAHAAGRPADEDGVTRPEADRGQRRRGGRAGHRQRARHHVADPSGVRKSPSAPSATTLTTTKSAAALASAPP